MFDARRTMLLYDGFDYIEPRRAPNHEIRWIPRHRRIRPIPALDPCATAVCASARIATLRYCPPAVRQIGDLVNAV